jgi:hypothetical protein
LLRYVVKGNALPKGTRPHIAIAGNFNYTNVVNADAFHTAHILRHAVLGKH